MNKKIIQQEIKSLKLILRDCNKITDEQQLTQLLYMFKEYFLQQDIFIQVYMLNQIDDMLEFIGRWTEK